MRAMGSGSDLLGLHSSGREFPVDISLSPIESDEGRLVIAAVRDMTERRHIEGALRQVNDKLGRELAAAAKIQKSLLPGRPAGIPGIDVEWIYEPCEKLGGDSFNAFEINHGLIGFYMLDVTGHGVVAALQSVALTRVLASTWTAQDRASPAQLTKWLNREFPVDPEVWQYFTFLCGMLDLRTGRLRYASAGHPGPIHVPVDGAPVSLEAAGLPIGWFADVEYERVLGGSLPRGSPLPLLGRRDRGDERRGRRLRRARAQSVAGGHAGKTPPRDGARAAPRRRRLARTRGARRRPDAAWRSKSLCRDVSGPEGAGLAVRRARPGAC